MQTSTRTLVGLKAPRIRPCVMPVATPKGPYQVPIKVPYKLLIMRHARRERAHHVMCPNQRLKNIYMALLPVWYTAVGLRHSHNFV